MNSLYIMADSGARGSAAQIRQLAGMRGLMAQSGRLDHRDADQGELPRRPERPAVLQLDARRAQGPGRYGAEDRELGLPDPSSRRRRAGRGRDRARLRHARRLTMTPIIEGGDVVEPFGDRVLGRMVATTCSRPARRVRRHAQRAARRSVVESSKTAGVQTIQVRSPITCEARFGVCASVLRARSGPRTSGQHRRSGRRHRRAVDRRARHAADHAYVPHRWRGVACGGGRQRAGQDDRQPEVQQLEDRAHARASGRGVAFGRVVRHGRSRPRARALQGAVWRGASTSRTAPRSRPGQMVAKWDPHTHPIVSEVAGVSASSTSSTASRCRSRSTSSPVSPAPS